MTLSVSHEIVNGEQVTTLTYDRGAVTYEFTGTLGGTFEYAGDGEPREHVVEAVREFLTDSAHESELVLGGEE